MLQSIVLRTSPFRSRTLGKNPPKSNKNTHDVRATWDVNGYLFIAFYFMQCLFSGKRCNNNFVVAVLISDRLICA